MKKLLKKGLTNGNRCGIITRSRESGAEPRGKWSLKIEQQERSTKHESMCEYGSRKFFEWEYYSNKSKEAKSKTRKQKDWIIPRDVLIQWFREFDPGSGWTLAACITHSSRTEFKGLILREASFKLSGGRVSNAWATCPCVWNNVWKRTLIPHDASWSHGYDAKDLLHRDGLASD